jgi:hypothetical protein
MSLTTTIVQRTNVALRPLSLRLQKQPQETASVGSSFLNAGPRHGSELTDPNDIGDADWATDLLGDGLEHHYLRLLSPDALIVELGPGSGRLSRHLIGHCKELVADR